ncbi:MAG: bacterial Ig-like domain-containing protein [Eubacteriales bacterium]|nr:bacterial Ig-like domain-containing protein [Eubacteriales bacterium]
MKKLLAILIIFVMMLGSIPVFAINTEGERTPTYTYSQYSAKVGQWGPFKNDSSDTREGPIHEKVTGIGGDASALHITGGPSEGGYIFSFNDGFIGGSHGPNKAYSGAIDATEFVVTYKSNCDVKTQFVEEFRIDGYNYSSNIVTLPSTNGEVVTKTISLSEYAGENNIWVYNMLGRYQTTNFNPVVLLKLYNIKNGHDITFEQFSFNWYQEDMVSDATISGYKESYFCNYDKFDYTQGTIAIKRGGSSEVCENISLNDPRVSISGFTNTALNNNLKLTATVLNKKITFYVKVVEYRPGDIISIKVNNPKTNYLIKEAFNFTIGSVTATFLDGRTETVKLNDKNVTITGFDSSSVVENQAINVSYGGLTVTYEVDITDFTVSGGITIEKPKRLYKVGDTFDWHTGTIVPGSGTKGKLFSNYATVTGFDSSSPVEGQVITVSYGGETTTYTIDIIEGNIPIKYKLYQDVSSAQCWKWGSQMYTLGGVTGKAENGKDWAIYIEGDGTHGGGGAIVFAGDCGAEQVTQDDGTVLDGLIGADALVINYINTFTSTRASNYAQYAPSFNFRAEYQNGQGTTVSTNGYKLPVTKTDPSNADDAGYWEHDFVIDLREIYDTTDKTAGTAESIDWLYNMKSVYKDGYAPSIQWRFSGKLLSGDILAIDKLYYAWYEDEPVESVEVINAETEYWLGYEFDYSGTVRINYKNGTSRITTMDNLDVSGFDSEIPGTKTITLKYAGKSVQYDIYVDGCIIPPPSFEIVSYDTTNMLTIYADAAREDVVIVCAGYKQVPTLSSTANILVSSALIKTDLNGGENDIDISSFDRSEFPYIYKFMLWDNENNMTELSQPYEEIVAYPEG